MHRTRGILPVLLATLPLMALAAACPMGAGIAASMLIWVELTLGMNLNTHVAHVLRRNGQEGSGSKVLRVAQLPWHAFAALFMSLWSLLLFWAIYVALMLAAIYLVRLPGAYYTLPPEPMARHIGRHCMGRHAIRPVFRESARGCGRDCRPEPQTAARLAP